MVVLMLVDDILLHKKAARTQTNFIGFMLVSIVVLMMLLLLMMLCFVVIILLAAILRSFSWSQTLTLGFFLSSRLVRLFTFARARLFIYLLMSHSQRRAH